MKDERVYLGHIRDARLTHGYFGVDLGLVWRVVERDLQALDAAVDALLSTPDAGNK